MGMDTLATWIRQNAVINSNHDYACVTVNFPNTILEWHNPMELENFVAELFPLRDWCCTNVLFGEEYFHVGLVWYPDDYIEGCQQNGHDEDERLLTPKGREKLADWVRSATQILIAEDHEAFDWDLGKPAAQGKDFLLYFPQQFFYFFGEKALISLILTQYPGYEFDSVHGEYVDEFVAVLLKRTRPVKAVAA